MATVVFTQNLRRHIELERATIEGDTVAEALAGLFAEHPRVRGYLLDDTGAVRTHVALLLDGESIKDRTNLSDKLPKDATLFVLQALSGG